MMSAAQIKILWLSCLTVLLVVIVTVVFYFILWMPTIEKKREDLEYLAKNQMHSIEVLLQSLTPFNQGDIVNQIISSFSTRQSFGKSGEVTIARKDNDQIIFLLSKQSAAKQDGFSIPLNGKNSEAMRRALNTLSGSMIALDYEGERVLAVYLPIKKLNLGFVVKVKLNEVISPVVSMGIISLIGGVLLLLFSGVLFRKLIQPTTHIIKESEWKYIDLVESINEWVWEIDMSGTLLYSSPKVTTIIGYEIEEVIGQSLYSFMPSIEAYKLRNLIDQNNSDKIAIVDFDGVFINKKQEPIEIELNAERVVNQKGILIGFRGFVHDISERKQKEKELKKYRSKLETMVTHRTAELEQVNKELRDFAYIVSHDLRSPLVSITGFTGELYEDMEVVSHFARQILKQTGDEDYQDLRLALNETIPESLHYIETAAAKMNRLINSILALSRIGGREFQSELVDVKQLVVNNLQAMAFQIERLNVSVNVSDLPDLRTDEMALEQIFANLLDNAIKYLSPEREGVINVRYEMQKNLVTFIIQDNGVGIGEKDLPQIFKIFKRVGDQNLVGEGMGLAYVQTLIRRLGGKIDCQSIEGTGSIFRFSIPRV